MSDSVEATDKERERSSSLYLISDLLKMKSDIISARAWITASIWRRQLKRGYNKCQIVCRLQTRREREAHQKRHARNEATV